MLSALRRAIAVVLALVVTVLTLGRVEASWSGERGGLGPNGTPRASMARVIDHERRSTPATRPPSTAAKSTKPTP